MSTIHPLAALWVSHSFYSADFCKILQSLTYSKGLDEVFQGYISNGSPPEVLELAKKPVHRETHLILLSVGKGEVL